MPLNGDAVALVAVAVPLVADRLVQVGHRHVADRLARGVQRGDVVAADGHRRVLEVPLRGVEVGRRRLPAVHHALGEGELEAVVVRLADRQAVADRGPVGVRPLGDVRERVVHAGHRVVGDVDVERDVLRAQARVDVVGLDRHRRADLPLEPERRLVAVGDLVVGRGERAEAAAQAGRRPRDRAQRVLDLLEGRDRAVERVGREVRPAVVEDLRVERVGAELGPVGGVRAGILEEAAGAAADHRAIVQREGGSGPRRPVVGVVRRGRPSGTARARRPRRRRRPSGRSGRRG